jgi:hypothetical protein
MSLRVAATSKPALPPAQDVVGHRIGDPTAACSCAASGACGRIRTSGFVLRNELRRDGAQPLAVDPAGTRDVAHNEVEGREPHDFGKCSYQSALALAAATSFSTIGRRAASKAGSARATSSPCACSARSSAIASSIASRVPEPIEKCAVRSASPISTQLRCHQRSFQILGNWRQVERLVTSR